MSLVTSRNRQWINENAAVSLFFYSKNKIRANLHHSSFSDVKQWIGKRHRWEKHTYTLYIFTVWCLLILYNILSTVSIDEYKDEQLIYVWEQGEICSILLNSIIKVTPHLEQRISGFPMFIVPSHKKLSLLIVVPYAHLAWVWHMSL